MELLFRPTVHLGQHEIIILQFGVGMHDRANRVISDKVLLYICHEKLKLRDVSFCFKQQTVVA